MRNIVSALKAENARLKLQNRRLKSNLSKQRGERKRVIAENERYKRFKLAADALDFGFVIIDCNLEGNPLIYSNRAFLDLAGYSESPMRGGNCRFLEKDVLDQSELDRLRAAVRLGERCEVTVRNCKRNGEMSRSRLSVFPVLNESGALACYAGTMVEVGEGLQVVESLGREQLRFEALFDQAPESIFVVSADAGDFGRILSVNASACALYGYSLNDFKCMVWADLEAPGEPRFDLREAGDPAIGRSMAFPSCHRKADGSSFPVEVRASEVKYVSGECLLIHVSDVGLRKRLEDDLFLEVERSELALSVSNDGFYDWNTNTGEVVFDSRYFAMAGYRPDCFPGTFFEWAQRVHPEDYSEISSALETYLESEKIVFDCSYRFQRESGDWMWVRNRAMKVGFNEDGSPARVIGIHRDVTHHKLNEEKLLRVNEELEISRDKAKMADRAKSEFLSIMSHELRTPLNPILGFVEILKGEIVDEDKLEMLNQVSASTKRMLDLVTSILAYVEDDQDGYGQWIEPFDLQAFFVETLDGFRGEAGFKGIGLSLRDVGLDVGAILFDRYKLSTILNKLVSNAVMYTEEGSVDVFADLKRLKGRSAELSIRVVDTGIGIPEKEQWKVFEPFQQIDSSLTRKVDGIGLGLPLARKFVKQLGGGISFDSEAGVGTEFRVTLPVSMAEATGPAERKGLLGVSGIRVLVVEDDVSCVRLLANLFGRSDCEVEFALDGAEAVELALREPFDLILMDLKMPYTDGLEASRAIRRGSSRSRSAYILAVTAQADKGAREDCLSSGIDDSLFKPVSATQLRRKVEEAFSL